MDISVSYTEEGKKVLQKGRGGDQQLQSTGYTARPHLGHVAWQKRCPHS